MVAPGFAPPACDAYKERRGRAFSAAWHGAKDGQASFGSMRSLEDFKTPKAI